MKGILTIIKNCDDMDIYRLQRMFCADANCAWCADTCILEELEGMAQEARVIKRKSPPFRMAEIKKAPHVS